MIQATQLKKGMCIKHENDLYRIVEAQHKTPGNLRGLVQTRIRSLRTGAISEHRFRSVDMVERAILDETEMEYLYRDGEIYHLRYGTAIGNDCLDILEFYTLGSASFFEGFTAPDKPAADMPKTDDIITRLSRNRQMVKAR